MCGPCPAAAQLFQCDAISSVLVIVENSSHVLFLCCSASAAKDLAATTEKAEVATPHKFISTCRFSQPHDKHLPVTVG